jgi:hypothetical protein
MNQVKKLNLFKNKLENLLSNLEDKEYELNTQLTTTQRQIKNIKVQLDILWDHLYEIDDTEEDTEEDIYDIEGQIIANMDSSLARLLR